MRSGEQLKTKEVIALLDKLGSLGFEVVSLNSARRGFSRYDTGSPRVEISLVITASLPLVGLEEDQTPQAAKES